MSVSRTARRSSLVLFLALAMFAWAAMASTSSLLGPATAVGAAQEAEDEGDDPDQFAPEGDEADDPDAEEDDDVTGSILGDEDGEEGDGTEEDGLEGDDVDDGFGDDAGDEGVDDEGDDTTPVGGVDAGFGGMAADTGAGNGPLIATAVVLLVLAFGAWTVQARRVGELRA